MRLLVSVASAAEASAALAGGADVIDAKDPHAGALGPVSLEVLRDIHGTVAGARPVSAALGDATDEVVVERDARAFIAAGALFVKIGFSGIDSAARIAALTAAAVQGAAQGLSPARHDQIAWQLGADDRYQADGRPRPDASRRAGNSGGAIAVWYADAVSLADPSSMAIVDIAARTGAIGVLLDTANKCGPGLRGLVAPSALAAWVTKAHDARLIVALAGKLTADDLVFVREAGADIAGVRGAACDDGRTGRVTADRVRLLRDRLSP